MSSIHDSRRESQLARESANLTDVIDAATGTTAADRRRELDDRLDALLIEHGAASFAPRAFPAAWPLPDLATVLAALQARWPEMGPGTLATVEALLTGQ
jgi:hypothetical protein